MVIRSLCIAAGVILVILCGSASDAAKRHSDDEDSLPIRWSIIPSERSGRVRRSDIIDDEDIILIETDKGSGDVETTTSPGVHTTTAIRTAGGRHVTLSADVDPLPTVSTESPWIPSQTDNLETSTRVPINESKADNVDMSTSAPTTESKTAVPSAERSTTMRPATSQASTESHGSGLSPGTTGKPITTEKICPSNHLLCDDNTNCVEPEFYCDSIQDCVDGSDEKPGCAPLPPGWGTDKTTKGSSEGSTATPHRASHTVTSSTVTQPASTPVSTQPSVTVSASTVGREEDTSLSPAASASTGTTLKNITTTTSRPQSTPGASDGGAERDGDISGGTPPSQSRIEIILMSQSALLDSLKSQISDISVRLDSQQEAIDAVTQTLYDHSWGLTELRQGQAQTSDDISVLKSAVDQQAITVSEIQEKTTLSTSRNDIVSKAELSRMSQDLRTVSSQVGLLEDSHTQLSNVVQHLISEEVWLSSQEGGANITNVYSNADHYQQLNNTIESQLPNTDDELRANEAEIQIVEEKTNKVLTSLNMWTKTEQIIHRSLADLHTDHTQYNKELSFLANYTLNNGVMISELAEARMADGLTIISLLNHSSVLIERLYGLKMEMIQNKNITTQSLHEIDQTIGQLLNLIQLNSDKVFTIQNALEEQGSLTDSRFNQTFTELANMESSMVDLRLYIDKSFRNVTSHVRANKEKSDMLWSRFRILDNRLAHVEVRYLTEELNRYKKSNDDLRQSLKLVEMETDMDTMKSNINIQQENHETLNGRLNTLSSSVDAMSYSLITMRSEWAEFNTSLPGLKSMYEEVMMIINLLPTDCDDVYSKGTRSSSVQLIKPGGNSSTLTVLCEIQNKGDNSQSGGDNSDIGGDNSNSKGRGWTVIQQRNSGDVSFNRNWTEYKSGFGHVSAGGEFWIGNDLLHTLTSESNYTVKFDMWTVNGSYVYAEYDNFRILSESEGYRLIVSGYSGNATDSLRHSNNMSFSTTDIDNDASSTHCAQFYTAEKREKHKKLQDEIDKMMEELYDDCDLACQDSKGKMWWLMTPAVRPTDVAQDEFSGTAIYPSVKMAAF